MKPKPDDIRLTLRPQPGPVPPWPRLRKLLKRLLRGYGLRCVALEEVGKGVAHSAQAGRSKMKAMDSPTA
jgi:hypothetical protein